MSKSSFHKIIFKSTRFFGASKLITMSLRVIVNKAASHFIGASGVGIVGYIENILSLIQSITGLGVAQSGVREVALSDDDEQKKTIQILYKWAWISGIIGVVISALFSGKFSKLIFDNYDYTFWFLALSLYFLFSSISSIRLAVLTGMRNIKKIVVYQIVFAFFSTIIAVLSYYFFNIKGIIPAILSTSFIGFLLSLYFTRSIKIIKTRLTFSEFLSKIKPIVILGILLSINGIFGQLCYYGIRHFLNQDSPEVLGIYQVSNTFLVSYLGLVFVAMSKDFYPRLTNFERDKGKFDNMVNDQTEIALLLIVPAVLLLYLSASFVVPILYSNEFLPVLDILHVGLLSVILKGIVWSIGYISLAKGDKPLYFKQNILGDGLNIVFSVLLYKYLNLFGLGIAITAMFLFSGFYTYWTVFKSYNFQFRKDTLQVILISIVLGIIAVLGVFYKGFSVYNPVLIIALMLSLVYSFFQLKKKL